MTRGPRHSPGSWAYWSLGCGMRRIIHLMIGESSDPNVKLMDVMRVAVRILVRRWDSFLEEAELCTSRSDIESSPPSRRLEIHPTRAWLDVLYLRRPVSTFMCHRNSVNFGDDKLEGSDRGFLRFARIVTVI